MYLCMYDVCMMYGLLAGDYTIAQNYARELLSISMRYIESTFATFKYEIFSFYFVCICCRCLHFFYIKLTRKYCTSDKTFHSRSIDHVIYDISYS